MQRFISGLIEKLKGEPYAVDSGLTDLELFSILMRKGMQVIRGLLWRFRFRKCHGLLFIGQGVRIACPGRITAGKNLTFGDRCRINALSRGGITLGDNVSFGQDCKIEMTGVLRELGEFLEIGDNTGIASNVLLNIRGPVKIGKNTIIGPNTGLYSENHKYSGFETPIRLQGTVRKGIVIGEDCWIGAGVIILDGVTVGDGCVIAAGAVVNRDIPKRSVAGGVPAKILKKRAVHENFNGQ